MLPEWPPATVTILATAGERPHAIPVSAALRAGPRHVLIALASGRESLTRLRADGRVALAVMSENVAITAHGTARVVKEELIAGVAGVEVEVETVQDHDRPEFAIESAVAWRWTDPAAADRDAEVHSALRELARHR